MPEVKLFGNLRSLSGGASFSIPGGTVREVLLDLIGRNPELGDAILDDGALLPHVRVLIDGRDVELIQGLDTPLTDQDEIAIFPPIAGG